MKNTYIAMWCNEGLECVLGVTDMEYNDLMRTLGTGQRHGASIDHYLTMMKFRARYNSQRHYEIYAFNAQEGISKEDIEDMFASDPQTAADTIRRIGEVIHSDRAKEDKIVIK
jgi:hypothetical protein